MEPAQSNEFFITVLSIEKTKQLINDPSLSDKEAEEIRDGFRVLAEIIFEKWQEEKLNKNKELIKT